MSEGNQVANEPEVLAWDVLRAVNRTQAKGSLVRLVVPSAPEVAYEVGMHLTEGQLLEAEEYLRYHGYIEPVDFGLSSSTYTITPAGLEWVEKVTEEVKPGRASGDTREDIEKAPQQGRVPRRVQRGLNEARKQLGEERPWWRRVLGR